MKLKEIEFRIPTTSRSAILLAALCLSFVTGACSVLGNTEAPSATQQAAEVAALQTHVLPVVKNLKVTWYLNEGMRGGSINWKRGNFSTDRAHSREDGFQLFDDETAVTYKQFAQAISASGVPTNRLAEAKFADDGTLRFASFQRRGGGITYVFTYIYSPGAKPPEWQSKLGPVVLTRIGDSDWWFEQSPDD